MQKTQTTCLVILATFAVCFGLFFLKTVLLPFVIALFIVIGCRPILEFLEIRLKLRRSLAFVVSFFAGVILILGFAYLIWVSVGQLNNSRHEYQERLNFLVLKISDFLPEPEKDPEGSPATNSDQNSGPPENGNPDEPSTTGDSASKDPAEAVRRFLASTTTYIQSWILGLASSLSTLLSYVVLILIFVFFLLMGNSDGVTAPASGDEPDRIVDQIEAQIRKYLVMKTVISAFTGLAFWLVLWAFGVPLAIVFGLLAFLLNFIPNLGPMISTVLPVPFLVLNSEMSVTAAIICFVLVALVNFISGNVIETRLMGKSFDVSPVFLLMALMFFGLIWGIVGMFLATPIVSIIKIVLQQSKGGEPIAELMAGRWSGPDSRTA